jgi:hypothetical protein
MLPGFGDTIALGSCGIALHFMRAVRHFMGAACHLMGAACHCLGDVVTDVLTFPGELVDRLSDTSASLSLAKLRGQSWGEPHRQAGAGERADQKSDHEAVISMFLRLYIHVLVLLSVPYSVGDSGECS